MILHNQKKLPIEGELPKIELKAIELHNITKIYKLYPSKTHQLFDVLKLSKFFRMKAYPEFRAIDNLSLSVNLGERIGIIGRNGSGKTTLLKMISGNFQPNSGNVVINGSVQALMQVGLGFHPEFSGLDNIKSSLLYNGLSDDDLHKAIDDIVHFVELGDFINQPVKTYSLGMMSRLQFAAATAIKPEILIVDEILGAGDGYFSAKSADRMRQLTSTGCTLLMVSHSMQQILQFCDRAIWINQGKIIQDGPALEVVKVYEEYLYELEESYAKADAERFNKTKHALHWIQERELKKIVHDEKSTISRFKGNEALKITNISLCDKNDVEKFVFQSGQEMHIAIQYEAYQEGAFPIHYVVSVFHEDGRYVSRHISELSLQQLKKNEVHTIKLIYPHLFLGPGKFVISAALYKKIDFRDAFGSEFYDLLSKSYGFTVLDKYSDEPSLFHHPAEWAIELKR